MTEKSSTHIAELFYTQYFKFKSKISCNFAKSIVLKNSKKSAEMAAKMANMLWNDSDHSNASYLKPDCYYET